MWSLQLASALRFGLLVTVAQSLPSHAYDMSNSTTPDSTTSITLTRTTRLTVTVDSTAVADGTCAPSCQLDGPDSAASDSTTRINSTTRITQTRTTRLMVTAGPTALANGTCVPSCTLDLADVLANTWQKQNFTATITAATVLRIVNKRTNTTRTTTISNELPSGYTLPPTNEAGTVVTTLIRTPFPNVTTSIILAYPTAFSDYPDTYGVSGVVPIVSGTVTTCVTTQGPVTLASHPEPPQASTPPVFPNSEDRFGYGYELVPACGRNFPLDFRATAFPDHPALTACPEPIGVCPVQVLQSASFLTETSTSFVDVDDEATTTSVANSVPTETGLPPASVEASATAVPVQSEDPPPQDAPVNEPAPATPSLGQQRPSPVLDARPPWLRLRSSSSSELAPTQPSPPASSEQAPPPPAPTQPSPPASSEGLPQPPVQPQPSPPASSEGSPQPLTPPLTSEQPPQPPAPQPPSPTTDGQQPPAQQAPVPIQPSQTSEQVQPLTQQVPPLSASSFAQSQSDTAGTQGDQPPGPQPPTPQASPVTTQQELSPPAPSASDPAVTPPNQLPASQSAQAPAPPVSPGNVDTSDSASALDPPPGETSAGDNPASGDQQPAPSPLGSIVIGTTTAAVIPVVVPTVIPNTPISPPAGETSDQTLSADQPGNPTPPAAESSTSISLLGAVIGSGDSATTILITPTPLPTTLVTDDEVGDGSDTDPATSPATAYVIAGQTIAAGEAITIGSGPSATAVRIDSVTPTLPLVTVAGQTYTANSASAYVIADQTLTPGGSITLASGSSSSIFSLAPLPTVAPPLPLVTVAGQTYTANSASEYIISDQTLTPGGSITLASGSSSSVISLAPLPTTAPAVPVLSLASDEVYTPNPSSAFVIADQTLTPGGSITLTSGTATTVVALTTDAQGDTAAVIDGTTTVLNSLPSTSSRLSTTAANPQTTSSTTTASTTAGQTSTTASTLPPAQGRACRTSTAPGVMVWAGVLLSGILALQHGGILMGL